MQVITFIVFAIGCASAFKSGPYLPSGWKPDGPSFYLPSEPQREQHEDIVIQESEASSSDALREYGPPKVVEVSQEINEQALPEVITEQAFIVIETNGFNRAVQEENLREAVSDAKLEDAVVIEAKSTQTENQVQINEDLVIDVTTEVAKEEVIEVSTEVIAEQKANLEVESVAEEQVNEAFKLVRSDVQSVQNENVVEVNQKETSSIISSVQEREQTAQEVITIVREDVRNIEEAITSLEQEIKEEITEVTAAKSVEEKLGSSEQVPEGFLEYGPPGFQEYGPPKGDLVSGTVDQEQYTEQKLIEDNETRRRRRFSPKFKSQSKRH